MGKEKSRSRDRGPGIRGQEKGWGEGEKRGSGDGHCHSLAFVNDERDNKAASSSLSVSNLEILTLSAATFLQPQLGLLNHMQNEVNDTATAGNSRSSFLSTVNKGAFRSFAAAMNSQS
jgi:hypothetical protein